MKTVIASFIFLFIIPGFIFSQSTSPLIKAISDDNYPAAKNYANNGQHIHQKDKNGWTPLHHIAMVGFTYDLHTKYPELFKATKYKTLDWVELAESLIEKGASVEAQTDKGITPIMLSLRFGSDTLTNLFVKSGATIPEDTSFLVAAVVKGNENITKHYLQKGASLDMRNITGEHLLFLAVKFEHPKIVQMLLEHGANPNTVTNIPQGYFAQLTPLHWAAMHGQEEIVDLLLKGGANANAQSASGKTPLHYAVCGPRLETDVKVNQIVKNTASSESELFVPGGNQHTVKLLLDAQVDLHLRDEEGSTPFYWAIYYRRLAIADLLLDYGALPDAALQGSPDQLFASGLSLLWYALQKDTLGGNDLLFSKSSVFFERADSAYQREIKRINLKKTGKLLLNVAIATTASLAANYQASVYAQSYGYGYSSVDYPVLSSQDLSAKKKYFKAQKAITKKIMKWIHSNPLPNHQAALTDVVKILDIKKAMEM